MLISERGKSSSASQVSEIVTVTVSFPFEGDIEVSLMWVAILDKPEEPFRHV